MDGHPRHLALSALERLDIETRIVGKPNEVDSAIPFYEDYQHADYDSRAARAFWEQLVRPTES